MAFTIGSSPGVVGAAWSWNSVADVADTVTMMRIRAWHFLIPAIVLAEFACDMAALKRAVWAHAIVIAPTAADRSTHYVCIVLDTMDYTGHTIFIRLTTD